MCILYTDVSYFRFLSYPTLCDGRKVILYFYPLWDFAIKMNSKDGFITATATLHAVHNLVTNF